MTGTPGQFSTEDRAADRAEVSDGSGDAPADASGALDRGAGGLRRHLWMLVLPAVFVLYSASFSDRPIIDREDSVLGDADAANFAHLIRDFDLGRTYGDPYVSTDRTIGDTAQKHKIHHSLYAIVAGYSFPILRGALGILGIGERRAVYSTNALVSCVNLILLFLLMGRFNPRGNPRIPLMILYAAALSTWVFGSVPESWPFSATLVLAFLLLLTSGRIRPVALAMCIGVAMLNNLTLGSLLLFVAAIHLRESDSLRVAVQRTALSTGATLATWMSGLSVLSLFDPALRPDRYIQYTLWFKDFTQLDLPPYSPFVWQSILSNLFVNSFVSNQSDASVPQEALLYTLQQSGLGIAAVVLWVSVLVLLGLRIVSDWRFRAAAQGWKRSFETDRAWDLVAYCASWVIVTLVLFYGGGFLYSTVVVPVVVIVACRFLDLGSWRQAVLVYSVLAVLIINNTAQILLFREVLASLS